MDHRAKSYEMEIKVAKNTEKDTKAALKREIKLINTKMFEAEKRFPEITQQFTRPLEEKLLLAYSALDEIEQQVDDVEDRVNDIEIVNGGSKRRDDVSEYHSENADEANNDENVEPQISHDQNKNETDSQNLNTQNTNNVILPSQSSFKDKGKKSKRNREERRKARELLANSLATSGNKRSGNTMTSEFAKEIERRLTELEFKINGGNFPSNIGAEDPNKLIVSFEEFSERKSDGILFDGDDEDRKEQALKELNEIECKRKLKENDQIVYDMYNKYRYLLEELNIYKHKLIEQISASEDEDIKSILKTDVPVEEMTSEQKDYQIYILSRELRLTRWNTGLEGVVNLLKENNIKNNSQIGELEGMINGTNSRLSNNEDVVKSLRDGLKECKHELKQKLQGMSKDFAFGSAMTNGELDPNNDFVLKITRHIKSKIDSEIEEIEKRNQNKFESIESNDEIKTLTSRLNEIVFQLGGKTDKLYVDNIDKNLQILIENIRTKTSVKISSMKDLAEDEVLKDIFSKLIDGRYTEYEKNLAKVYAKLDVVEGDIEKCISGYSNMVELKKDLKKNEQKVEKVYTLMQQSAFEKDEEEYFSSEDNDAQESVKSSKEIPTEEFKSPQKILTTSGLKTVQGEGELLSEKGDRLIANPRVPSSKQNSNLNMISDKDISVKKSKFKEKGVSMQKFNAIKIMFSELSDKVVKIDERLKEREYADQLVFESTAELIPQMLNNNGNSTNAKANSMIQNEFIAIKHLVGRHQMSIVKIESALKQINEWKNEFNVAKIYEDHKSDLEILKKYIEEVNDYNTKLFKNTESQLHTKADFNFFEEFKQNVEDRVMKDLKTKIDKIDHKRIQNTIKKKFEAIEKEINEIEKNTLSGSHPFKSPFLKANDK